MKQESNAQKKFEIKILPIIVACIVITISVIIAYFTIKDVKSYPTEEIEQNCNVETYEYASRKVFKITPKEGTKNNKVILYFHGGAYFAEMTKEHWDFIEKLVKDTGSMVILPDYPLAPRHNCVDVFNMVTPLYKEIIEKINPENLIMMGDSAGGGLALALEENISEQGLQEPEKTILISPWLDLSMENPEIENVKQYDTDLNYEALVIAGMAYAGEKDIENYLVSPIYGDLSNLKNITIFTGTYDILNPDVHILEQKFKENGTNIKVKEYKKASHIWIIKQNCDEELVKKGYEELLMEVVNE